MEQLLCAVYDNLANDMLGQIMHFKNETIALRTWNDICSTPNSAVRMHINDFMLVQIGTINTETLVVTPTRRTIITGAQWAAAQPQTTEE